MASAWGHSWGSAWGSSWGAISSRRGGSGRRRHYDGFTEQVHAWWETRDALVARTKRLEQEKQRRAVEASTEAVSRTLEAAEDQEDTSEAIRLQFETMIAAVDRAIEAKTAAKVLAAAKQAEEEAIRILEAIEDENAAILLLLA